jgi:energy-coupling factor transporter transmembrane protein EcfT
MFFLVKPAYAQCPICVITVGGGLLIAKKLGIDDLLISIWISGLNTAIAFWIANSIKKKILNNPILWSVFLFITSILYFYYSKQIGHLGNTLFGIDKILLGMTIGMLVIFLANIIDMVVRKNNKGKVLFPYQKVVVPLFLLLVFTLIFKYGFKLR